MFRGLAKLCAVIVDAGVAAVDAVGGVLSDGLRRLAGDHEADPDAEADAPGTGATPRARKAASRSSAAPGEDASPG